MLINNVSNAITNSPDVITGRYSSKLTMVKNRDQHTKVFVIFKISNASDPKVKLRAVAIANDCYKFILDMTTNAGIVSDALKYVEKRTEQLTTMQKLDDKLDELAEQETTTNGVF